MKSIIYKISINKTKNYLLLIFLICTIVTLTFNPVFAESNEKNSSLKKSDDSKAIEISNRVLKVINKERAKYSIKPLELNHRLLKISKKRSVELSKKISHTRTNGKYFSTISYLVFAENIGAGFKSPESFARAIIKSKQHRENILNPKLKTVATTYTYNKKGVGGHKWYWSQVFGMDSKYKYKKVTGLKVSKRTKNNITLSWDKKKSSKITGYQILKYNNKLKKYTVVKTSEGINNTKYTKNFKKGTKYKYKVRAYEKNSKKTYYSFPNSSLTVST